MKEIPLTKGKVALVDDADYDWLNQWKWYAAKSTHTYYAHRRPTKYGKLILMHRLILGITDPKLFPDHKDRNGLNNCRNNLRIATRSDNNSNRICLGVSGYMGVFRTSAKKERYFARIIKHGKRNYLGSFDSKIDAALAYNKAALELHGEFANLNVIEAETDLYSTADQRNGRPGHRLSSYENTR